MNCPRCGRKLKRSRRDARYYYCPECRRRYRPNPAPKFIFGGILVLLVALIVILCVRCSHKDAADTGLPPETSAQDNEAADTSDDAAGISLLMVGDVLLHDRIEAASLQEDGSYDYHALFANTQDEISGADLALVNQEVIIGGEELGVSGYPYFNASEKLCDALCDAGFDVICHATNHAMDCGAEGILNCRKNWQNHPAASCLGIYESQEQRDSLYIYEQNGIRIAILNYTYGVNGDGLPAESSYLVNQLNENVVIEDIKKAEENADFTVICPHWGTEYQLTLDDSQRYWADLFLKNGADLVIGTHPHVIEPIEWLTDETTGNKMLVYYSIGNFVNWTGESGDGIANRMVGGMAKITIAKEADADEASIVEYGIEPLVSHVTEGTNGVTAYKLRDYTDNLAAQNRILDQDAGFSLEYCNNLCKQVWGDRIGR